MSVYESSIAQFKKMLSNLDRWIEAATQNAQKKSFDVDVLVHARLAPDQYSFVKQVQSACDSAKFAAARLTGKEAPKHPDTEQTIAEIRQRIATCIAYLDTFQASAFTGVENRMIELPFLEGKLMKAEEYLVEMATPNFYFHLITAYAILRHNGVDIGKRDYIGALNLRDPK